jgi:hypothetical protein
MLDMKEAIMSQSKVLPLQEQRQPTNTSVRLTGLSFDALTARTCSRIANQQSLFGLREHEHNSLKSSAEILLGTHDALPEEAPL